MAFAIYEPAFWVAVYKSEMLSVPIAQKLRREFGSMKDIIWVADDFDEPLTEEFNKYM